MEKIKQALEKARQEREKNGATDTSDQAAASRSSVRRGADEGRIEYTKTRSIEGSIERMREKRLVSSMEPGPYTDALKILSAQTLQRMSENGWTTLMVTSPRRSEGRTTIAINLGLSIAREVDYTVLIVDATLRSPRVHEYFGLSPDRGLSDYLADTELELPDLFMNPRGIDHFVILPAGTPTMMSAERLGSPGMAELVTELKSRYEKRLIIFDMPSVLDTADTVTLAPLVDAALMVIEDDVTPEKDLKAAIEMLNNTNVVGTVLNKSMYR